MTHVWITHPNLTPEHDQKVLNEALGQWAQSGWQVREDQTEPTPDQAAAAELAAATEAPSETPTETPASNPEPRTAKKKGEV